MGVADAGYSKYESGNRGLPYSYDDSGLERRMARLERILSHAEHKLETGDPEKDMVLYELSGNYDKLKKAVDTVSDKYFSEGRYEDITKILPTYLRYEDAKKKFVDAAYNHIDLLLEKEKYGKVKDFFRREFSFKTEYKYSEEKKYLPSMDKKRYIEFSEKTLENLQKKYADAKSDAEYDMRWYNYENHWNRKSIPKKVLEKLDKFDDIKRLIEYLKEEDD